MLNLLNHKKSILIAFVCLITLLIALYFSSQNNLPSNNPTQSINTVKDDLGRKVSFNYPPLKIISLAPSITEMLFTICPNKLIIGRTQNCNFPPVAMTKTVVNNYPLDFEKLAIMQPDIVFALEGITSPQDIQRLNELNIPTYVFKINTVENIIEKLKELGKLTNFYNIALSKSDSINQLLNQLPAITSAKKTLMIISADPLYVFGNNNYAHYMLKLAGGLNAIDTTVTTAFPMISREYLLKINPDIIVTSNERTFEELLIKYPETKAINAFKNRQLKVIDEDLLSRPSPRVHQTILEIRKAISN